MQEVIIPYDPRSFQREIHSNLKRFNVLVCHRRFGKTVLAINELIVKALESGLPNRRYAYFAPFRKQAKSIAWDYLKRFTKGVPGVSYNESELRCDFLNGSRIYIDGIDNPNSLRGTYLDGAVMDEFSEMPPIAWEQVIAPMTVDRQGFIIFTGTPKGHNHFYNLYQRAINDKSGLWYASLFKASESGVIPERELAIMKASIPKDAFDQEFECSFQAAVKGSYYGELINEAIEQGRIGTLGIFPNKKVHTAWDLGVSDSTAIWFFQVNGSTVHLIDYYESSGVGIPHYVRVLEEKKYLYGNHYAPHDIKVREFGSGKTRIETAKDLGLKFKIAPHVALDDGIHAAWMTLPMCFFDREKCDRGIEALKLYRKEFNDKVGTFKDAPLHDWTSHAADAFRYLCLSYRQEYGLQSPRFERTLGELMDANDRRSSSYDAWAI